MPAETAANEPQVIVVATAAAERCAQICRALGAVGVEVIRSSDVYLALGEIAASSAAPPRTVVVQAASLESSELEFFALASRLLHGCAFVFGESQAEEGMVRTAVAAGAIRLDMDDLSEWATTLADSTAIPPQTTDNPTEIAEEPGPSPLDVRPEPPTPAPEAMRESCVTSPPSIADPVEDCEPEPAAEITDTAPATDTPDVASAETQAPSVQDCEPATEMRPVDSRPLPTSDLRIARPIAIPHEWPLRPAGQKANSNAEADDDGAVPAVPWRPPVSRPARTPPSARAAGPALPDRLDSDVELTREEIDALLNDPTATPDSRRHNR